MNKNYFMLFLATLLIAPSTGYFVSTLFEFSPFVNFILGVTIFGTIFFSALATFMPKELNLTPDSKPSVFLFLLIIFFGLSQFVINTVRFYNESVKITNQFNQKMNERLGFYNTMYLIYTQKTEMANVNKQTFIEVAKILMDGRKDGQNLSWKWVQENQPVPFAEFTHFYNQISEYVEKQRNGFFSLEKECMSLATAHDNLLQSFPNNMYNLFVNRKRLLHTYSILSEKAIQSYQTKLEQ